VNTFGWFIERPHLLPPAGPARHRHPDARGARVLREVPVERRPAPVAGRGGCDGNPPRRRRVEALRALSRPEGLLALPRLRPAGVGRWHAAVRGGPRRAALRQAAVRLPRRGPAREARLRAGHRRRTPTEQGSRTGSCR
jgi:hypothetical protein